MSPITKTVNEPASAASIREAELFSQLQKMAKEPLSPTKAEALFRLIASEYLGGVGAAHLKKKGKKWAASPASITGQVSLEEVSVPRLQTWFGQAIVRNKDLRFQPDPKDPHQYLIAPAAGENGTKSILLVKCKAKADPMQIRSSSVMLQMIATFHDLVFARGDTAIQRTLFESSAAVIELVTSIEESDSVQHACHRIVHETKRFLKSTTSCIGILRNGRYEIVANSDVATLNHDSELFRFYENAWQEASLHQKITVWPPGKEDVRHGLIQHRKLIEKLRLTCAISIPLRLENDNVIGALTVVGDREQICRDPVLNFLTCAGPRMASAIELLQRAQEGSLRRKIKGFFEESGRKKLFVGGIGAFAFAAMMLFPIPYRVRCKCDTDALTRRFVAAPFDGVIQNGVVRAGDIVSQDQVLAEMSGREIRRKLASAMHDKHRAEKKRDLHLAEERVADSLLAELEARKLTISTELLETRESQLKIKSPIDGIVLNGDLDRTNNMPVELGDKLYEIGSLDVIKLNLAIPSDEVAHVQPGMTVQVWLRGLGSESIKGRVERVLPDSEIKENQNIFTAEVVLPNPGQKLKPGMQGTAVIVAKPHSLAWNLFHKPIEYVASRLSW